MEEIKAPPMNQIEMGSPPPDLKPPLDLPPTVKRVSALDHPPPLHSLVQDPPLPPLLVPPVGRLREENKWRDGGWMDLHHAVPWRN